MLDQKVSHISNKWGVFLNGFASPHP